MNRPSGTESKKFLLFSESPIVLNFNFYCRLLLANNKDHSKLPGVQETGFHT